MWKWRFIQMTSHLSASQKKKKKGKVGVKEFFATSYLVTKSQITSLFLAHSLSGSPFRSVTQMVLHTHTQTPAQCCQQSPLTVYHGCGNSSSVMYEKNASKNKHENLDIAHTRSHNIIQDSAFYLCAAPVKHLLQPRLSASRLCLQRAIARYNN